MSLIKNLWHRTYTTTYNIGFIESSSSQVALAGSIAEAGPVHWMVHPFRDRFFADPFILSEDEKECR